MNPKMDPHYEPGVRTIGVVGLVPRPGDVSPSSRALVPPAPMAAQRLRQRAREAAPIDGDTTLSERDAREQQAIADRVEGILP
jgi:hypothetical protein